MKSLKIMGCFMLSFLGMVITYILLDYWMIYALETRAVNERACIGRDMVYHSPRDTCMDADGVMYEVIVRVEE